MANGHVLPVLSPQRGELLLKRLNSQSSGKDVDKMNTPLHTLPGETCYSSRNEAGVCSQGEETVQPKSYRSELYAGRTGVCMRLAGQALTGCRKDISQ